MAAEPHGSKDATPATCTHNRSFLDALPFGDRADFEDAARGFIGTLPKVEFRNDQGRVIYSLEDYAFLAHEAAPDTVNPSLWRQARLNMSNGLFQVTDRIYQVRGFDISNMTIIEGSRGVIVIDPLVSTEIARAGIELYFQHRGRKPVTAVIYSHSHADHFGGVRGVIDEADVKAGNVAVIAPDRFMEEVTKENVLAGTPMIRRAMFQFGAPLPKGPRGQVDAGLGKVTSRGTVTLIPPTLIIKEPIEVHTIDGVEMIFQLTPDTEAPAEMHMFYPALRALNLAENATHNLHNVYPIRGAQVRDANAWAKYLNEARDRFATKADVVFAQHHWPVWGNARLLDYLAKQRDTYKYLHDQTAAAHEPRPTRRPRSPSGSRCPRAWRRVARARLLRHAQPQRQGGVPVLSRLVRRQSRRPQPAACGARQEDGRLHGRRGCGDCPRAGGLSPRASTAGWRTP